MNRLSVFWLLIFLWVAHGSLAYGPTGHEIVGGIADKLLENKPAGAKLKELIDGISLEKAAVMPDEIKGWDKNGVDDPKSFHYRDHPKIDTQLREFWRANPPTHDANSPVPSHHWFHYTDVPILNGQKYSDGKAGRNKWDVVQMIPYCTSVLRGEIPEDNPRKITKAVAIILIAHYVGDIHQPLHVGAEYFDQGGQPVDPDKVKAALEDEGGNTLTLEVNSGAPETMARKTLKLHGFWDNDAVMANLPSLPLNLSKQERHDKIEVAKRELIDRFSHEEPKGWRLADSVALKNYAEGWADEILPLAREAHERLRFVSVHPQQEEDRTVAAGMAQEKPAPDHVSYADWSAKIVRQELHKAGWRLADLVEKAVASTSTPVSTFTPPHDTIATAPVLEPAQPGASSASAFGTYPANYKEIATRWMRANAIDISRVDWQGEPKPADLPGPNGAHLYGYLVIFNGQPLTHLKTQTYGLLIRDGAVINASGLGGNRVR